MDLSKFKDKLGGDFDALKDYVDDLVAQRDTARRESIDGRKTLKSKAESQEALINRMFERLGIGSAEELDSLPDAKGQADAMRQLEARIKRAEREKEEAVRGRSEIETRYRESRKAAAISQAVSKHPFIDPDTAALLIGHRAKFEGDDLFYEGDGGKLIPIDEAAAMVASSKPHLVKAQGGTGSGYRDGGGGGQQRNPWAKETFNLTEQIQLGKTNPQLAAQLKAAAGGTR